MAEDGISIKFNTPDFARQLRALSQDLQEKVVRAGNNAAAQVFKKAAAANAPVLKRGARNRIAAQLQRSIYVFRARDHKYGFEHHVVAYRVKGAKAALSGGAQGFPYGIALEQGWTPRGRGSKRPGGNAQRRLLRQRAFASGGVIIRYRFLGPAFAQKKNAALEAFVKRIEARVAKANRDFR